MGELVTGAVDMKHPEGITKWQLWASKTNLWPTAEHDALGCMLTGRMTRKERKATLTTLCAIAEHD